MITRATRYKTYRDKWFTLASFRAQRRTQNPIEVTFTEYTRKKEREERKKKRGALSVDTIEEQVAVYRNREARVDKYKIFDTEVERESAHIW